MRLRSALVAALVAFAACRGSDSILTKGARFPDDEGVATQVTLENIEIDGKRSYPVAENVESFTTRSHETTPLLSWKGKYVQIGLDGDRKIEWVAGVGVVVRDKVPYTLYTGVFARVDKETGRAIFEDGTTLDFAANVTPPRSGEVLVTIDPKLHAIARIERS